MSNSIVSFGDPLVFPVISGNRAHVLGCSAGSSIFKVEARQLERHQKEAVVTEGTDGPQWRVCSDEGAHLKGHDFAPFPLGFFNSALHGDLFLRLSRESRALGASFRACRIRIRNGYWLTGSFALGTGEGHAEPTQIRIEIDADAAPAVIRDIVDSAVASSPAIALLRTPLRSTFALYINGRRRAVTGVSASDSSNAVDPYIRYAAPPRPAKDVQFRHDLIEKTGVKEEGTSVTAPAGTTSRIVRNVIGNGVYRDPVAEIDTYLELPGASHFVFRVDDGKSPSGLGLLAAGIAFCYMTQLSRYIEHMRLAIRGVRLVQFTPFSTSQNPSGRLEGSAAPIDTHLYLNGEAPEEIHAKLLTIAARTCYLHATAASALAPSIATVHNGVSL